MARWEIKNVGMKGVAMTVPENVVKTSELGLLSQEEADVFDNTVGIKERHIAPDTMCASDMCQAAAEKLLEELGWEKDSIDVLLFESVTGDYRTPPTFCIYCKTGLACRKIVSVWIFQWVVVGVCMP